MKTYNVSLNDETVYSSTTFNQKEIEQAVNKAFLQSKNGDEIDYWTADKKYACNFIKCYENRNGKFCMCVFHGDKTYYQQIEIYE